MEELFPDVSMETREAAQKHLDTLLANGVPKDIPQFFSELLTFRRTLANEKEIEFFDWYVKFRINTMDGWEQSSV